MNHFDIDHTLIKMECSVHFYSGLCASLLTQVTLIQIKGSLKKKERKEYVFGSASFGLKQAGNLGSIPSSVMVFQESSKSQVQKRSGQQVILLIKIFKDNNTID